MSAYNRPQMREAGAFVWPEGAVSALSLAFDGGLPEHIELVLPILAEHEVKATFYVTVPALLENPIVWKKLAEAGHEIGSHSLWGATVTGELPAWTLEMLKEDLRMTEKGIAEICEVPVSSFALPGLATECSEGDYRPVLSKLYTTIRTPEPRANLGPESDLLSLGSMAWKNLQGPVESFLPEEGQWNIAVFDGFFGPEYMAAEDDLRFLLAHLGRRKEIWTAPVGWVGEYISKWKVASSRPSASPS